MLSSQMVELDQFSAETEAQRTANASLSEEVDSIAANIASLKAQQEERSVCFIQQALALDAQAVSALAQGLGPGAADEAAQLVARLERAIAPPPPLGPQVE